MTYLTLVKKAVSNFLISEGYRPEASANDKAPTQSKK